MAALKDFFDAARVTLLADQLAGAWPELPRAAFIEAATDGLDALEKAQSHSIDLVLTDQNMPNLDGLGLTRKLRESLKFKNTPILILTTESSDVMKQAGRSAGATGWLVKPFDPGRLIDVIEKVIR